MKILNIEMYSPLNPIDLGKQKRIYFKDISNISNICNISNISDIKEIICPICLRKF